MKKEKLRTLLSDFWRSSRDGLKRRTGKSHDVGDWPDRFRASEDVGAGVREKLMGVDKIRTAKHVEDDRERVRRVGEIVDFPVTDANELACDESGPGLIEEDGVLLPGRILGESGEGRAR